MPSSDTHQTLPYIVGLTGGIGSGKTVVSDYLQSLGVPVIDTDVIARQVVEPGQPALQKLADYFGNRILHDDGSLDRDALRRLAFASEQSKAQLDLITHPAIREETRRQIAAVRYPYCLVVVPLLTAESAFTGFMQRILVVTADTETRTERVMQRSQLTREEVQRIMQTQLSDKQRLAFADDAIANDGTLTDARAAAHQLHEEYLQLAEVWSSKESEADAN